MTVILSKHISGYTHFAWCLVGLYDMRSLDLVEVLTKDLYPWNCSLAMENSVCRINISNAYAEYLCEVKAMFS